MLNEIWKDMKEFLRQIEAGEALQISDQAKQVRGRVSVPGEGEGELCRVELQHLLSRTTLARLPPDLPGVDGLPGGKV